MGVSERVTIHIHHVPLRFHSMQDDGEPRWCFVCRKRVQFTRTVQVPVDPMSYYGPSVTVHCDMGHTDGDLFPGRIREWSQ